MKHDDSNLRSAIVDAAARIYTDTGAAASGAFDELVPADFVRTPAAAHAVGLIEGAALALGMTPIELLDDLGITDQR